MAQPTTKVFNFSNPDVLSTGANHINRTKYFAIEVFGSGLQPGAQYTPYYNGADVSSFCKQFGKLLGSKLTADDGGRVIFQMHIGLQYNQFWLVNNKAPSANGIQLSQTSAVIELVGPDGRTGKSYLPLNLKA